MDATEQTPVTGSLDAESRIVGFAYIIISSILLSIYLSFNAVLIMDREFRTLQAHRLMLFMGILDCIQLICHLFSGFVTIWKTAAFTMPHLSRIIGAAMNSAWIALFPASLLIAIQRFLIIRNIVKPNEKFPLAMKGLIALCFAYYFAFWICLLYVGRVFYVPERFSWTYGTDGGSVVLSQLEIGISYACIGLTYLTYLGIVISIYKKAAGVTTIRRSERQLLLQASILFLTLTVFLFLWHFYHLILPDTKWTLCFINLYWILYCGLNPILNIIFSK